MTIRSVDLQVLIPRATEVGKSQYDANHQDTLQQQQFAEQWEPISIKRQKQVQGTTKSEGGKVGREQQHKEQSQSNNRNNHDELKESDATSDIVNHASNKDPVLGHLIDIKT